MYVEKVTTKELKRLYSVATQCYLFGVNHASHDRFARGSATPQKKRNAQNATNQPQSFVAPAA
jgi:hypothetical protein